MYDPTGQQPGAVPSRVLTALRGETQRLDAPASDVSAAVAGMARTPLICDPAREHARRLEWERLRSGEGDASKTKRLDAPAVTGAQVAAPTVTHTVTLHVDASAVIDATRRTLKGISSLRRPDETATFLPEHPSLRPGETLIHDRTGKLVRRITPDAARSTPAPVAVVCPNGNTEAIPAGLSDLPTPERRSVRMLLADEIDTPDPASFSRLRAELAQRRAEAALNILAATTHSPRSEGVAHAADMAAATLAAAQALLSAHVLWRGRAEAGGLTVPAPPLSAASDDEQGA